ncbi:MAG: GGDEF domain-containing protein [Planctomycetota bacterium]|nr:GGDEF domain-containing protein [Planctomycetota bacterium]
MTDSQSADRSLFSLAQIQHLMRVEFNRAQRYDYPIVCMMIAVDRLGHLRDLYGYDAKEEIVEGVVGLLKTNTRSSDFLGRLADDRLLAVVPHTPPEGAQVLAGRLLSGARNLQFAGDGRSIQVTLSIGASHNSGGATLFFDAMLVSAEDALADASGAGGDRCELIDPGAMNE